jgi:hypothetical protein
MRWESQVNSENNLISERNMLIIIIMIQIKGI